MERQQAQMKSLFKHVWKSLMKNKTTGPDGIPVERVLCNGGFVYH